MGAFNRDQTFAESDQEDQKNTEIPSLSELWAKKYVTFLEQRTNTLIDLEKAQSRIEIAQKLAEKLRSISAQAWNKTETLLSYEVRRHKIPLDLIDPWAVSKDVHQVYEQAISAYVTQVTPQRFSVLIAKDLGNIRKKHSAKDPRVIGFVSMQFHYCGQLLAQETAGVERAVLSEYFKVVDDLLYMPLHRAYEAAAAYEYHHPRLETVRTALPATSRIAKTIVDQVTEYCPGYVCHSGPLSSPTVRISSIRDVEMFQIYLWTCVLEKSISAIAQELFPLCVMLYPTLKVSWGLVRLMINLLDQELANILMPQHFEYYEPHYKALLKLFSPEVFPEVL